MNSKRQTNKWNNRYISLAKEISAWSKDPSRKIGAVAIGEKGQVLSQGYNGFPRGIFDYESRYSNRETKYQYVVHAEMNCIYNATYNGVSLADSSLFVWGLPACSECAKGIIQVGIKKVYWSTDEVIPDIWEKSLKLSENMFKESGVDIIKL